MKKIVLAWSGGKDSLLALEEIRLQSLGEVVALVTKVEESSGRVAMHGIGEKLIEEQVRKLALPSQRIYLPPFPSNKIYEKRMGQVLEKFKEKGATGLAFGDLFLEDIRQYREEWASSLDFEPLFPLWNKDTEKLAWRFIQKGHTALITSVDLRKLDSSFLGRNYDENFLRDLPEEVDPCGENGEFHTFVYASPLFESEIVFQRKEIFVDGDFAYAPLEKNWESFQRGS